MKKIKKWINNLVNSKMFILFFVILALLIFLIPSLIIGIHQITKKLIKFFIVEMIYYMCYSLMRLIYNTKVTGLNNIPPGPAVLICNHVSFLDFLILGTLFTNRKIRFVMDYNIYKTNKLITWICETYFSIPVSTWRQNTQVKEQAFSTINRYLNEGHLVLIFPEGEITYTGEMNEFKSGIDRIQLENKSPIVPIGIKGLSGGFFSRVDGLFNLKKVYGELRREVDIRIGSPIKSGSKDINQLRETVQELIDRID